MAEKAIELEHRRYEDDVLEALAGYHAEHKRLSALLLSGKPMTREARRELERRIEFAGNQADRAEKKWDAHVRRIAESPWDQAALARKKACALLRRVIQPAYDVEQTRDLPRVLPSSDSDGSGTERH